MNFKLLLSSVSLAFIIAGCSFGVQESQKTAVGEFDNAPTWVKTKQVQNSISELGEAKGEFENFREQRDAAIGDAKEKLAHKLNVKVLKIFKSIEDVNKTDETLQNKITLAQDTIVQDALHNSKVLKLWQSNVNNIYVLVATDIDGIKKEFNDILLTSFRDESYMSGNYKMELEKGSVDRVLQE